MRNYTAPVEQADRRSEQLPPQTSERRERGLWTFLTWAFFLSQVIAADEAMGAASRPGAEEDTQSNSLREKVLEAGRSAPAFSAPVDAALSPGSAFPVPPVSSQDVRPVQLAPPNPFDVAAAHDAGPAHTPAAPHQNAVHSGTNSFLNAHPDVSADGNLGATVDPSGGITSPIVTTLDDVVDAVLTPILGTVGDVVSGVVGAAHPVLDGLVDSVNFLGGTVAALDPVVDQVVSPIVGGGDLLSDVLRLAGPDAVDTTLADMGLDPIQTVGNLLGSDHEPAENAIGPAASPHIGGEVLGSIDGAVGGLLSPLGLSSGRTIEFPTSGADHPHYEMMAGGSYTDYGLMLQRGDLPVSNSTSTPIVTATDLLAAIDADENAQAVNPAPLVNTMDDTRVLIDALGL